MRIAVDGMGGDNAPAEIVKGCIKASTLIEDTIIIVGDQKKIEKELNRHKFDKTKIQVQHASEVIENDDPPVRAVRLKKDSSMVVGLNMLKAGDADVFLSAGNTGALMAGSLFGLGRIQGIDRPCIATAYPRMNGGISLMVDSGANVECKPTNLLEFAVMGSIYVEKVMGIPAPKVGLVNIGTEETKGTTAVKSAYEMLQRSSLNFMGNVEAREIPSGTADVLVCDGFVGNVIIKLTEGLAFSIFKRLKEKLRSSVGAQFGSLFLAGKLKEMKKDFDYSEYGGAPILGVRGAVVKAHGAADSETIKNAILKGRIYVKNQVVQVIENSVLELEEIASES